MNFNDTHLNYIRQYLKQNELPLRWLVAQLAVRNVKTCCSEVCRVFAGSRKGEKANLIILTANQIIAKYETAFGNEK